MIYTNAYELYHWHEIQLFYWVYQRH